MGHAEQGDKKLIEYPAFDGPSDEIDRHVGPIVMCIGEVSSHPT